MKQLPHRIFNSPREAPQLDMDYDGRSLFPRQVFFPMAGDKDGRTKLARHLNAEIDTDLIEAYRGTVSLPFEPGEHGRVAVKIVDRGVESLKVIQFTQAERGRWKENI